MIFSDSQLQSPAKTSNQLDYILNIIIAGIKKNHQVYNNIEEDLLKNPDEMFDF